MSIRQWHRLPALPRRSRMSKSPSCRSSPHKIWTSRLKMSGSWKLRLDPKTIPAGTTANRLFSPRVVPWRNHSHPRSRVLQPEVQLSTRPRCSRRSEGLHPQHFQPSLGQTLRQIRTARITTALKSRFPSRKTSRRLQQTSRPLNQNRPGQLRRRRDRPPPRNPASSAQVARA